MMWELLVVLLVGHASAGDGVIDSFGFLYVPPSPPPPPLSTVQPNWVALYVFLAVLALYVIVMAAVIWGDCCGTGSTGERAGLLGIKGFPRRSAERPRSWMQAQQSGMQPLDEIDREVKKGFVRKVYSILGTQLFVTTGIVVGFIYGSFYQGDPNYLTSFGHGFLRAYWLTFLLLMVALVIVCALMSLKNSYPANYVLLFLFTSLLSVSIGRVCVVHYALGGGTQILMAVGITAGTFLALTAFTMLARVDFDFLGPFIFAGCILLLFWSLLLSFVFAFSRVNSSGWGIALAVFGSVLFCAFIIYDTNKIIRYLGVDDVIIAAIELYLDVLNLFVFLLSCLSLTNSS